MNYNRNEFLFVDYPADTLDATGGAAILPARSGNELKKLYGIDPLFITEAMAELHYVGGLYDVEQYILEACSEAGSPIDVGRVIHSGPLAAAEAWLPWSGSGAASPIRQVQLVGSGRLLDYKRFATVQDRNDAMDKANGSLPQFMGVPFDSSQLVEPDWTDYDFETGKPIRLTAMQRVYHNLALMRRVYNLNGWGWDQGDYTANATAYSLYASSGQSSYDPTVYRPGQYSGDIVLRADSRKFSSGSSSGSCIWVDSAGTFDISSNRGGCDYTTPGGVRHQVSTDLTSECDMVIEFEITEDATGGVYNTERVFVTHYNSPYLTHDSVNAKYTTTAADIADSARFALRNSGIRQTEYSDLVIPSGQTSAYQRIQVSIFAIHGVFKLGDHCDFSDLNWSWTPSPDNS